MTEESEAVLDPWLIAPGEGGDLVLFGYALAHPVLGGLAWTRSSPLVELDEDAGTATTMSGRRYRLGRRIDRDALHASGEAVSAYVLLVKDPELSPKTLGWRLGEEALIRDWLRCCKAARHLGIEPPPRDAEAVGAWIVAHRDAYSRRRN